VELSEFLDIFEILIFWQKTSPFLFFFVFLFSPFLVFIFGGSIGKLLRLIFNFLAGFHKNSPV